LPAPPEGFRYLPGLLGPDAQTALVAALRQVVGEAPLYRPAMPKSGRPFSVRMTNAGSHGWYADKDTGYGYIARHPQTGQPWPAIPPALLALWQEVSGYPAEPECCLVNGYAPEARMGLPRDPGLRISGPAGMLHSYDGSGQAAISEATGNPFVGMITGMALYAQAPPIYGGTDQIQKNIISERVLGLPKEPNNDRTMSFAELPKNV